MSLMKPFIIKASSNLRIILLLYNSTAKAYNTYIILCIAEAFHSVIDTYEGVVI